MAKVADIKTKENDSSVNDFIDKVEAEVKRNDCKVLLKMMKNATNEIPKMWGTAIIGFGNLRYKSPASGREVDWFKIGFSPRKANFSLYLGTGLSIHTEALKKLGKHKTGMGCLYINKLDDVDLTVLQSMIKNAAASFSK